MKQSPLLAVALITLLAAPMSAQQDSAARVTHGKITNAGVARANLSVDSVFVSRTLAADTIEIGDFTGYLFARLGVPPFPDSLQFSVSSDTVRARISGRLMDFPADARGELGMLFTFMDSTSAFTVDVAMPQGSDRLMRFRLERVTVRGIPVPDMLLAPALAEYAHRYPVLADQGKELLIEIPVGATARMVPNGIAIFAPVKRPS